MTTPQFTYPTLMTALARLYQATWATRLPDVMPGQTFWADGADVPNLLSAGLARLWQTGDPPAPPPEPPYTVNGVPGLGAGTSNSSH